MIGPWQWRKPPQVVRTSTGKTIGRVGYEAYAVARGAITLDGRKMPGWQELPPETQGAWEAAALALLQLAAEEAATFDIERQPGDAEIWAKENP